MNVYLAGLLVCRRAAFWARIHNRVYEILIYTHTHRRPHSSAARPSSASHHDQCAPWPTRVRPSSCDIFHTHTHTNELSSALTYTPIAHTCATNRARVHMLLLGAAAAAGCTNRCTGIWRNNRTVPQRTRIYLLLDIFQHIVPSALNVESKRGLLSSHVGRIFE